MTRFSTVRRGVAALAVAAVAIVLAVTTASGTGGHHEAGDSIWGVVAPPSPTTPPATTDGDSIWG